MTKFYVKENEFLYSTSSPRSPQGGNPVLRVSLFPLRPEGQPKQINHLNTSDSPKRLVFLHSPLSILLLFFNGLAPCFFITIRLIRFLSTKHIQAWGGPLNELSLFTVSLCYHHHFPTQLPFFKHYLLEMALSRSAIFMACSTGGITARRW